MKKVMFLVMVAVLPFISCSNDDDNGGQATVIGKWRESKSTEKSFENGEYVDTKVTETTTKEYFELDFKADGTFTEFVSEVYLSNGDSGEEIVETSTSGGIYELKGDIIIITYPPNEDGEEAEVLEMPYSVSANTLTIISVDEYSYDDIDYKDETTIEFHRL